MNSNKILRGIFISIIILVIFSALYFSYKSSKKDKKNFNLTTKITTTKLPPVKIDGIVDSKLPNSFKNYKFGYWNYEKLYNYYYTITDKDNDGKNINIPSYIKFLKVENGKLMWNVNNEWIIDEKIDGQVEFITYSQDIETVVYYIFTSDKLYIINTDSTVETLTTTIFNEIEYNTLSLPGKIQKVGNKIVIDGCDYVITIVMQIDNKIYSITNVGGNKYSKIEIYFNNKFNIDYSCYQILSMNVESSGIVKNAFDNLGLPIKVKEYIPTSKNNLEHNDNYQLIIDQNDYLYSIYNDNFGSINKYNFIGKVKSFKVTYSDKKSFFHWASNINIELADGKIITLNQVVN